MPVASPHFTRWRHDLLLTTQSLLRRAVVDIDNVSDCMSRRWIIHANVIRLHDASLPRDAMRKRGFCCRPVSVRLSVRPSVTLVHCIHTAEDIVKLLCRPGSSIILFFDLSADIQFQGEPLQRGRKFQGGGKILQFSTEIAVYLGNGTI